jgi:hypothetical protein
MKFKFYISFLFTLISILSKAAPGDTTWVQAQTNLQLNYYNNFDTTIAFPANNGKTYRKIIMVFTLGKYQCPAGSQYCGDWDYTIQNYLMTKTDTFELGRLITPYANASYPRTPWTWTQPYYFDVTDFYPNLHDSATIRLLYSGYSGGFTANIKFAFIEGTPPRYVIDVKHLWGGSFAYGDTSNPIANHLPTVKVPVPLGTQYAEAKFTATGHGSDNLDCMEFCSKYYKFLSNSTLVSQNVLWRSNCGSNELYPQSGTWVYNRANWCPGDYVYPNIHKLPSVTPGTITNVGVTFQPYTSSGGASFTIESALFFYGPYNNNLDASIEGIVSPSNDENNWRENPLCGKPVIQVRNSGATNITSISFQYGLKGQTLQTYTLSGVTILPMVDTTITLPELGIITTLAASNSNVFTVNIAQVNGVQDNYQLNDTMTSVFATAPDWPSSFTVTIESNDNTQTSWEIVDMTGAVVKQRSPAKPNTTYTDQIQNLASGCYELKVTDAGCDGLYWWANTAQGQGYIKVTETTGSLIHLTNGLPDYTADPQESQDFGCGFNQFFRIGNVLPVDLLSFTGKRGDNVNMLYWETTKEINANHFDLEFSTDGIRFNTVSTIKADGSADVTSYYHASHSPSTPANTYYYRLKMVDNSGDYKYSSTVILSNNVESTGIANVFPNPFNDKINFSITTATQQNATALIYDVSGKVVKESNIVLKQGINNLSIDELLGLYKGVYLLTINIGDKRYFQKIIKG